MAHGGTVTPPCNRKGRAGNPPPTGARASALPDTERLDIVPAQLQVIVTVRPKYACRVCEEGVTQAEAPAYLIEGALPTEGAIAHVLASKYSDHCPLHRQPQIRARHGRFSKQALNPLSMASQNASARH